MKVNCFILKEPLPPKDAVLLQLSDYLLNKETNWGYSENLKKE